MKIGITGTRSGMDSFQIDEVSKFLADHYQEGSEFHHGDCVGVDVEAALIAQEIGYKIICHPPSKDDLRGYFKSDAYREPDSYFARNRNIVNETELLMVVPFQTSWQPNGGTWYTHDYAKKMNKKTVIIYPKQERAS